MGDGCRMSAPHELFHYQHSANAIIINHGIIMHAAVPTRSQHSHSPIIIVNMPVNHLRSISLHVPNFGFVWCTNTQRTQCRVLQLYAQALAKDLNLNQSLTFGLVPVETRIEISGAGIIPNLSNIFAKRQLSNDHSPLASAILFRLKCPMFRLSSIRPSCQSIRFSSEYETTRRPKKRSRNSSSPWVIL